VREVLAVTIAAAVLALVAQLGWCEELVVSAAVSLSKAFKDLGRDFEREHTGVKVLFNFGASGQLLQQIAHGAPVDVFASADQETMDRAEAQQLILAGTRSNFVRNRLVLIVPGGAASAISSIEDLKRPQVARTAIGKPDSVPAGRYAQEALELAGLWEGAEAQVHLWAERASGAGLCRAWRGGRGVRVRHRRGGRGRQSAGGDRSASATPDPLPDRGNRW
jgi:molybdate transport system substrate-binding protein